MFCSRHLSSMAWSLLWTPFSCLPKRNPGHSKQTQSQSHCLLWTCLKLLMVLIIFCTSFCLVFSRQYLFQLLFSPFYYLFSFHIKICIWKTCPLLHYRIEEIQSRGVTAAGLGWVLVVCVFVWFSSFNMVLIKNILDFSAWFFETFIGTETSLWIPATIALWSWTGTTPINTICASCTGFLFHLFCLI